MKANKKTFISEDSESPFLNPAKYKNHSNPVGLFKNQNRKFDVPIRMPALDDSSSITASEENNGKTPPEIDIQKMLKK